MLFFKYLLLYYEEKRKLFLKKQFQKIETKISKIYKKIKEKKEIDISATNFANEVMENSESNWKYNDSDTMLSEVKRKYKIVEDEIPKLKENYLHILEYQEKIREFKKSISNLKSENRKIKKLINNL